MYKDMLLKLDYHKNHIIQTFIKKGYFPTSEEVANKLEQTDTRLAMLKQYKFQPGEKFNTKEMNHMLNMLYNDIVFLYKILEDIQLKEYNKLLLNIETHMSNLESLASHYKKRTDEEVNSMSLGKTLLFQTNNWDIDFTDDKVEINLGDIDLIQGSKISCFANINNADKKNIIFKFIASDSKNSFNALPYNYNNDTYLVPGEIAIKESELVLGENFNINSEINIPFKTNLKNSYKILGGKGKMVVTDKITNTITIEDIPTYDKPFKAKKNCFISFYIEGKGNIEYNFNKKPLHCNFSLQDGIINITNDIQKVFLDVEEGFICYFNNNDSIGWATLENGIVYDDYLTYNGIILVRDFKVKEYIKDKTTKYNVKVIINENDNNEVIDCIYIKEVE